MATVPTQEAPNARPARDDHCPPTRPKERPRTLADVPQAVLHKEIFRFDALQRENAHLRSEVARLRKILTQPFYEASLELIKHQASVGAREADLITDDLVDIYAESEEPLTLADQWPQLTTEDKCSIVPQLVARGFCVETLVGTNVAAPISVYFKYEWSDADRRKQQLAREFELRGSAPTAYHAPPPPRFKVGDAILCKTGPAADAWEPGSIVKIGWAESVLELEKDYVAAYQIQLANSEDLVYAPNDTDEYVRPYVRAPPDDAPPAKKRKLDIYPPEVPSCDRINTHS